MTEYEMKCPQTWAWYMGYVHDYNENDKELYVTYPDDWKSPEWIDITSVRYKFDTSLLSTWRPSENEEIECKARAEEKEPFGWFGCKVKKCIDNTHNNDDSEDSDASDASDDSDDSAPSTLYSVAFIGWGDQHNEILNIEFIRKKSTSPLLSSHNMYKKTYNVPLELKEWVLTRCQNNTLLHKLMPHKNISSQIIHITYLPNENKLLLIGIKRVLIIMNDIIYCFFEKQKYILKEEKTAKELELKSKLKKEEELKADKYTFPISVSSKQLMDKIKSIDYSINDLVNQYQHKIKNSDSLQNLHEIYEEIQNEFDPQYEQLKRDKFEIYKQLNSSSHRETSLIEGEISNINKNIVEISKNINNLDDKIKRYHQMMKQCEDEKTEFVRKSIMEENERRKKQKSLDCMRNEWMKRNELIQSMQNELKSNESASILSDDFNRILREYEDLYNEWSNNDVIEWMKIIEKGKFNEVEEYTEIFSKISGSGINGNTLHDLQNETCLKVIGLNKMERKCLLKNIDRILNKENNGQNKNICTVCTVRRINSVFIPCGHQLCCYQCYEKEKRRFRDCPICRKRVQNTVKTFMNGF